VLCYPVGQEYIRSHRAFYQLAVRLARAGFHVLRFDYYGCGDSEGDFEDANFSQWTEDIVDAVAEIRRKSGWQKVCLIGMRLGATLSMMAAANQQNIEGLILWEPIVDGKKYLEELAAMHKSYVGHYKLENKKGISSMGIPAEVIGFPMTTRLVEDLKTIDPYDIKLPSETDMLVLINEERTDFNKFLNYFKQINSRVDHKLIPDHKFWLEELYKRLIPVQTLQHLVSWIDKVIT